MKIDVLKIKIEMLKRGWGFNDLAKACEPPVPRQTIQYTLRLNSIKGLDRIAKALDMDAKDLLT
jgi:hypothetical protein